MVLPVKFGFYSDLNNPVWDGIDILVDSVFYLDMILTFFTPYWENEKLIISLKAIACNYFQFWFIIDFLSIFPFEQIIDSGNALVLVRISRLPRLYRLVKITRMFRGMKATRSQNNIWARLHDFLKLSPSILFVSRL